MPYDLGHAASEPGVDIDKIRDSGGDHGLQRGDAGHYPDVGRFTFEAGRVATARKDSAEARRLVRTGRSRRAYPLARPQCRVGVLCEGGNGVPLSSAEAARWYRRSSVDAGEPIAMVDLGWLYEMGRGVGRNCTEAVRLYENAVAAGEPDAMNNLGLPICAANAPGATMPRPFGCSNWAPR